MKNKKGFTLVELLAVIVVLGVILSIAATSVINVIKANRAKTFSKTMDVVVQSAKSILAGKEIKVCDTDACVNTFKDKLISSLNISSSDYEISITYENPGYKIKLSPGSSGKFKNIVFNDKNLGDGVRVNDSSLEYILKDNR